MAKGSGGGGGFGLSMLSGAALQFVVIALVISFGAMILAEVTDTVETDYGNTSTAYTTLGYGEAALGNFAGWLPILALVILGGVILFILFTSFGAGVR